ncbi:MAG: 50S ribosomal protein L37ae [Nanoarchaeota archaeon]
MATKKVGTTGRFGARYGRRLRQKVAEIEKKLRQWHKCPYCNKMRVRRLAAGIWFCRSCESKFTGKAYEV